MPTAPSPLPVPAYDPIADLYDRAFADIRVRRDEWRWIAERLTERTRSGPPRVLDLGCGNGAMLLAMQGQLHSGVGVDVSARFIALAQARAQHHPHLTFAPITHSALPFADNSFDVITSFLSFRYLDWDPVLSEARRVLRPHGQIWIVDMVSAEASFGDAPVLARSALRHALRPWRDRRFHRDVAQLTAHPDWHRMLQRHPIRHVREYEACFSRWFPGRTLETLNCTPRRRVIAIDSGVLFNA